MARVATGRASRRSPWRGASGEPALIAKALHARTFSLKQPDAVRGAQEASPSIWVRWPTSTTSAPTSRCWRSCRSHSPISRSATSRAVAERLPRCIALLDLPVGLALRSQLGFFRVLVEVVRGRYGEAIDRASEVHELFRRTRPARSRGLRVHTAPHHRSRPRRHHRARPAGSEQRIRDRLRTRAAAVQRRSCCSISVAATKRSRGSPIAAVRHPSVRSTT